MLIKWGSFSKEERSMETGRQQSLLQPVFAGPSIILLCRQLLGTWQVQAQAGETEL